jgi:hypothetical protein
VLSCFGAGVSSGLVIDMGAEKTSICCVDEGLALPKSRFHLAHGGDDVTEHLAWLLKRLDATQIPTLSSSSSPASSAAPPPPAVHAPFHALPPAISCVLDLRRPQHFMLVDALKQGVCYSRAGTLEAADQARRVGSDGRQASKPIAAIIARLRIMRIMTAFSTRATKQFGSSF